MPLTTSLWTLPRLTNIKTKSLHLLPSCSTADTKGWYFSAFVRKASSRLKSDVQPTSKMDTALLPSSTTTTSGVLADRLWNIFVLLQRLTMVEVTQECLYILTVDGYDAKRSFANSSTILSCLATYIPLYAWQPFRMWEGDSVMWSWPWCKQWGDWEFGNQIERLSLDGRTCNRALTV